MATERIGRPAGDAVGLAGQELRRIRLRKRMTLEEVGAEIGMTRSAVSALELGKYSPTVRTLEKLADALGVTLEIRLKERRK